MSQRFTAACIQTNSERDILPNIETTLGLIRAARDAGADLITMPECVTLMEPNRELLQQKVPAEADHPAIEAYAIAARETGAWILAGSLAIKLDDGMIANRSYLFSSDGDVLATYDKIHMFDVDLGDGDYYRESETYAPGSQAVIAETPWGRMGMTICYDVRFPYLYRELAQAGADFIAIPAAFTKVSGEAHWHVLQRARAIENGCFILAAAQTGTHADNRQTYGHSLIVDPWGKILADAGEDVGFITAEIDLAEVAEARRKIPALTHDRPFSLSSNSSDRRANRKGKGAEVIHPRFGNRS
ncbi:MAG: carbon-nitrogen hydrolase family protein [Proteobacteria bacterium]|nr:carbon-nitrogen hydrolase family protein [Pseudomonadota bacterium]